VVKIFVPYTSEYQVINHRIGEVLSRVSLSVLMPLQTVDDAQVATWTLSACLKNPQFYGMAPDTDVEGPKLSMLFGANPARRGYKTTQSNNHIHAQAGGDSIVTPLLSAVTRPIQWITDMVGSAAQSFGFSKVNHDPAITVVSNVPARGFTHVAGPDCSVPLSAMPNNAVTCDQSFDNEDEMSIAYIGKRPYMLGRTTWPILAKYDTLIGSFPVHPAPYSIMGSEVAGRPCLQGPPSALTASLFNWWRGNMTLNLNFTMTAFHQGRLKVQYFPYGKTVGQPIEDVFTQIIDISQLTDKGVALKIPSVMRNKWYGVYNDSTDPTVDTFAGYVVISVFTPLVAAPTVPQTIGVYAYIHWDDLELAEPGSTVRVYCSNASYSTEDLIVETHTYGAEEGTLPISFDGPTDYTCRYLGVSNLKASETIKEVSTGFLNTYTEGAFVTSTAARFHQGVLYSFKTSDYESIQDIHFVRIAKPESLKPGVFSTIIDGNIVADGPFIVANVTTEATPEGDLTIGGVLIYRGSSESGSYIPHVFPAGTYPMVNTINASIDLNIFTYFNIVVPVAPPPRMQVIAEVAEEVLAIEEINREIVAEVNRLADNESWWSYILSHIRAHAGVDEFTPIHDASSVSTTMGESVTSLRSLTRRATVSTFFTDTLLVEPLNGLSEFSSLRQSMVDIISFLYRFYSGSWRYKMVMTTGGLVAVTGALQKEGQIFDTLGALHIQDVRLNPIIEISKPFYNPSELLAMSSARFESSTVAVNSLDNNKLVGIVLKAAGNDHRFTFMVGAPAFFIR
jgi:hypothetical protein